MKDDKRQERVLKNASSQIISSLSQSLLGFVARKIFLITLGADLLGLNSLMTSIIGMLSIAELGVGEAINFSLYEPLAKSDTRRVTAIMQLYRKLYLGIAAVIGVLGVVLFFFLHKLVDSTVPMADVYKVFALFLLDACLSYCLAYKRNIISADQQDYIVINIDTIAQILLSIGQILLLLLTKSFYAYLILKLTVTVARNIYIFCLANKKYPYLKDTKNMQPLSKQYLQELGHNVKALFVTRISYFCVSGTDNMLLSSFVSLASVTVYNNYVTILSLFNRTFNAIFDKVRSVIGNYIVLRGKDQAYTLFKRIFFANFLITSYTSIGIFVVTNSVISLWMGPDQIWPLLIVGLVVFNNYSRFILQTCEAFRGAMGIYSPRPFVKYAALAEGLVNLVASLALIMILDDNILAVFLGTTISSVVSTIVVPWISYKFIFNRPLGNFFLLYLKYLAIALVALVLSQLIFALLSTGNCLLDILTGIAVCTAVTAIVYLPIFYRTDEFRYLLGIAKRLILKKRK